jgi:hypothetical protein
MYILAAKPSGRTYRWLSVLSLGLALLLAACNSSSNNGNFNSHQTKGSGNIGVNQAQFTGNLMFVKSGNIFVLHGKDDSLTQLSSGGTAAQPSLSPNGQSIAFEVRNPANDYSDLATMTSSGTAAALLTDDSLHNKSTGAPYHYEFWAANPIWSADGKNIFYLTDFFKGGLTTPGTHNPTCFGLSAGDWILDMGIAELPANSRPVAGGQLNNPPQQLAWPYCYAGGDQDLSLRPGASDTEILFTSFDYAGTNLDLVTQLSLLDIPANGGNSKIIQLSTQDPKVVALEPSFSPDGRYITYIRRQNGEDDLYIMPVDATITGTANQESYYLTGGSQSVYYTNTSYYQQSQKLLSGIIGQPVWGANNTLFFMEFTNGEFNLYMAKLKIAAPASAGATPTTSAAAITLAGAPVQITQGGIDGASRAVWFA